MQMERANVQPGHQVPIAVGGVSKNLIDRESPRLRIPRQPCSRWGKHRSLQKRNSVPSTPSSKLHPRTIFERFPACSASDNFGGLLITLESVASACME